MSQRSQSLALSKRGARKKKPSAARRQFIRRLQARRQRSQRRGIALIMVLGAITVLTVFLTELQEQTSADLSAALVEKDALQAEFHARSAVNLGRMVMASEPTVRAAILATPIGLFLKPAPKQIPIWAFTDILLGAFNDADANTAFGKNTGLDVDSAKNIGLGIGKGRFELKIIDEDSKINVNGAASGAGAERVGAQLLGLIQGLQYNPLFEREDADGQFTDRVGYCSAIIDWTDPDQDAYGCDPFSGTASSAGAEDNIYQVLDLGYQRKNAAYDSLEELRLVRGIGDDFWATFVDPNPSDPSERVLTVWGLETLNVNTANAQTLLALTCSYAVSGTLCEDETQQASFIMAISLLRNMIPGVPLFGKPSHFIKLMTTGEHPFPPIAAIYSGLGIEPVVFRRDSIVEKALGVQSKRFSIYATGIVPGYKRETRVRIHAVLATDNAQPLGDSLTDALENAGLGQVANDLKAVTGADDPNASNNAQDPSGNIIYWRVE